MYFKNAIEVIGHTPLGKWHRVILQQCFVLADDGEEHLSLDFWIKAK